MYLLAYVCIYSAIPGLLAVTFNRFIFKVIIHTHTHTHTHTHIYMDFLGSSDGKASTCNVGDMGSIPVSGRSPGEGNGNPLQYSCLEDSMDRGTL